MDGASKKMKLKKETGPDGIPIEVCRCLETIGNTWLTDLNNRIWWTNKTSNDWRRNTLVPIYKNKGDIQDCSKPLTIKE